MALALLTFLALPLGLWLARDHLPQALPQALAALWTSTEPVLFEPDDAPPFRLDRTEVSRGRWSRCVAEGACAPLPGPHELPAVGLTAAQAEGFCAWAGGQLPTEVQWRLAAGPGPWPWGETDPTCDHANALGCGEALAPTGTARAGATDRGVLDLYGNAWEWVASDGRQVLVGGSARTPVGALSERVEEPGVERELAGVRCAYAIERR